jgi:DNA polymerase I-like protein with 3'-5' exonuclease and polymerase domains
MSVLGTYAHAADPRLMSEAGEKAHASIVFALKGRRLSFIDEGPREGRWAQERLKQLTGGGELTANEMNQNPITFRPTHTLMLTTNDEPVLTDPAIRARVRLLPCEGDPEQVRATRAAIGHVSGAAWRAEAPGVLATMLAEAAAWLADPTTAHVTSAPEHIRYLAEHLGAEQDPVAVWQAEETEPFEAGTPSRELYQAFTASCLRNNLRRDQIPSETKWGRQLTRLGYPSFHTEHGKRRQLRVSSGGFLPGMDASPSVTATGQPTGQSIAAPGTVQLPPAPIPDGYDGSADLLLPGSEDNPSTEPPQVNPTVSVPPDGSDGLRSPLRTYARDARAQEALTPEAREPVNDPSGEPAKPKRTTKASETASAKREVARQERIAATAGALVDLPAVVTRDGRVHPADLADVDALLAAADLELTVDVETTGYPVGHEHFGLRTIQLGNETFAVVLDAGDAEHRGVAARHLAGAPVLHAHSATADLVPLAVNGVVDLEDSWRRMHDTVVTAKLADPRSTGSDPGLKKLALNVLGDQALTPRADAARSELFKAGKWLIETKVTTPLEKSGWAQVDPRCETMVRYAASDVLDDAALAHRLPQPEPEVLERERLAQRMTARVAHRGLRIDGEHVQRLLTEHRGALAEHAGWIRAVTANLAEAAIENPGSDAQVGAALLALGAHLPRTPTGRPSVAEGVLTPLTRWDGPGAELARLVLAYRKHETAIGLFLEPYEVLVQRGDGRARPTVYTLGADTGRMSCVRPNLQQVPREGGFRACITADPGQLLVSADFASVELRVAAALSGDANLRSAMVDANRDPHWEMARLAFGPNATKADRYAVKRGVFGRIYGGGVAAIARGVGVEDHVAQAIIDALDASFPTLAQWSRMVRDSVQAGRTQFRTYSGRVVYLDQELPHKAPNYLIQGTARELLIDALVRWSATRWGEAVLLPVHDELVVVVPEAEALEAQAALVECMTSDLFGVPIVAEADAPTFSWQDSA